MYFDQAAIGVAAFITAGYSTAQVFHQVPPMVKKSRSVRGLFVALYHHAEMQRFTPDVFSPDALQCAFFSPQFLRRSSKKWIAARQGPSGNPITQS